MREQHVLDALHLLQREVAHAGAGIDEHVPVDQEGCRATFLRDRAGAAEDTNLHGAETFTWFRNWSRRPTTGRMAAIASRLHARNRVRKGIFWRSSAAGSASARRTGPSPANGMPSGRCSRS